MFSSFCSPSLPIIRIRKLNFRSTRKEEGGLFAHSAEKRFFHDVLCGKKFVKLRSEFIRKSHRSLGNQHHFANSPNNICALFNRDFHLLFKLDQTFNSSRFFHSLLLQPDGKPESLVSLTVFVRRR